MDWFKEIFKGIFEDDDLMKYMADRPVVEQPGPQPTGGPLGLGDPYDRSLNRFEEKPLIPKRIVDISKTVLCKKEGCAYDECWDKNGVLGMFYCIDQRNARYTCMKTKFEDPNLKEAVTEEYLNERSHYRATGILQKRYMGGKFMLRDTNKDPALDKDGKYRPQKPLGWDESYPDGPPDWANFKYDL